MRRIVFFVFLTAALSGIVPASAQQNQAAIEHFNRAAKFYNSHDDASAAREFQAATEADPSYAAAYYYLGMSLLPGAIWDGHKVNPVQGTVPAFQTYLALQPDGEHVSQVKELLTSFGAPFSSPEVNARLEEIHARQSTTAAAPAAGAAANTIVPVYNISGVSSGLNLSGKVLADIFLGKITSWSDPAIRAINPGIKLPDRQIVVVHRSDENAETNAFTSFLAHASPDWRTAVGEGSSVRWAVGLGAKGDEGITAILGQLDGSIGYVRFTEAVQDRLNYGTVPDAPGNFIQLSNEEDAQRAVASNSQSDSDTAAQVEAQEPSEAAQQEAEQEQQEMQERQQKIQQLESDAEEADQEAQNWDSQVQQLESVNSNCTGLAASLCQGIGEMGAAKARQNAAKSRQQAEDDREQIAQLQNMPVQHVHIDTSYGGALQHEQQQHPMPTIQQTLAQQQAQIQAVGAANSAERPNKTQQQISSVPSSGDHLNVQIDFKPNVRPIGIAFSFSLRVGKYSTGDGAWGVGVNANWQTAIDRSGQACAAYSQHCGVGNGGRYDACKGTPTTKYAALATITDEENTYYGTAVAGDTLQNAQSGALSMCNHNGCKLVWSSAVDCSGGEGQVADGGPGVRTAPEERACTDMTASVKGQTKTLTGLGHCDAEAAAYLTNQSSETLVCQVGFFQGGKINTGSIAEIDILPGQTQGGESGGLWMCGADVPAKAGWFCYPKKEEGACHSNVKW